MQLHSMNYVYCKKILLVAPKCNIDSCCSFLILEAIAKNFPLLFAIAFKNYKEQQRLLLQ